MSIHYDGQHTREDAPHAIEEQETIAQPMRSPTQPPPQTPPRPPRGTRERRFIVSALLVVLVLVLALGSVFVVQLARRPATQAQPSPTVAATTPAPTATTTTTPTPPAGTYQPINALWMSDATTGWARTTTHLILRTTDGGKSWQVVSSPNKGTVQNSLGGVIALSSTNIWAMGYYQNSSGPIQTLTEEYS